MPPGSEFMPAASSYWQYQLQVAVWRHLSRDFMQNHLGVSLHEARNFTRPMTRTNAFDRFVHLREILQSCYLSTATDSEKRLGKRLDYLRETVRAERSWKRSGKLERTLFCSFCYFVASFVSPRRILILSPETDKTWIVPCVWQAVLELVRACSSTRNWTTN